MARNPYVLVNQPPEDNFVIVKDDEARHLASVLRARPGYPFVAFDGNGRAWQAKVSSVNKREVTGLVNFELPKTPLQLPQITVAVGVVKGQHMDFALEKAAEIGATRFIPMITELCVIQPGDGKVSRWRSIALSAAKQAHRRYLMDVAETVDIRQILASSDHDTRWGLSCNGERKPIIDVIHECPALNSLLIFIGPEGGFTDSELELFQSSGVSLITLGENPLRTETAVAVTLGIATNCLTQKADE